MESNKDEALKCLSISQRHLNGENYSAARRFAEKSISLFPTPEASKLLERINELDSGAPSDKASAGGPSGSSTSTEAHPSASGAKHRHATSSANTASSSSSRPTPNGTAAGGKQEKREYTPEQAAIVKRILSCKITEYYEVMSLKKDCTETDVKKAYRKLALQLHPDKNGAPGADEAFKMVSKAFQILSDADKRAQYDRFGSDPDSRFSGVSSAANGSPGFAGARSFDGELTPEELFNMFFEGGGGFAGGPFGGGGFGGPGVFTASFGPGGFTRVHVGGRRPRAAGQQGQQQEETSIRNVLAQIAPLLILFLFTFLSAVPNIFSTPRTPDPRFSFTPSARFNMGRETEPRHVKYFVNQAEFSAHPVGRDVDQASGRSSVFDKFERSVEATYIDQIYMVCQHDQERQQRRKEAKMGFLGIGADWNAIKKINEEKLESCEEYNRIAGR